MDRVAIHEAGHAVALVLLGREVVSVTIMPDGDVLGETAQAPPDPVPDMDDDAWDEWLTGNAVYLLAGHEAERRVSAPEEFGIEGVVDHDWSKATKMVREVAGQYEERQWALLNRSLAEARVLLARNWSSVEKVADELRRKGTLSGADVSALLDEHDTS